MAIERIDNGDGTTTFRGVDVTIPASVADDYDVAAVRLAKDYEMICCGKKPSPKSHHWADWQFVILAPRPTWKPPASLAPGEYEWVNDSLYMPGACLGGSRATRPVFRDLQQPTRLGRWRVNEDGTATYLGES